MSPVTTESSQPAQPAPEAPQSAPAAGSSSGNQNQLRIAVLVVIAAIVGVGLWLALGNNDSKKKNGKNNKPPVTLVKNIGPVLQTPVEMGARALTLSQPIYWAGPKKNMGYEFWRVPNKNIFVRYLPAGVKAGEDCPKCLIVGTYPLLDAYNSLKKQSDNKGTPGPDGSYVWQPSDNKTSVYIAWKRIPYEVEVYNKNPQKAATIALSGDVQPIIAG